MANDFSSTSIAIVGAGPAGMVALKEFRDLGYDVTVFEKKEDVGGVWMWSEEESATTALRETKLCNNKYSVILGDYPVGKDFPWLVTAPALGRYFRDYAKHYELYKNIDFKTAVTGLSRDENKKKWILDFAGAPCRSFDKVIWATGTFVRPRLLTLPSQTLFSGPILHSSQARDLSKFKGKSVIVVGIGNTAADTANALVTHGASSIYLSHRRGATVIRPTDHKTEIHGDIMLTAGLLPILWWIQKYAMWMYGWMMDSALSGLFKDAWGPSLPEWGLEGTSLGDGQHYVVCSQDLVPNLKSGAIRSISGVAKISGPMTVEFDDGSKVEDVDAIIACTGYDDDMSMLNAAIDFTPAQNGGPRLPKLYMNTFPPRYKDSFAYLSLTHLLAPQIPGRELAALAVPQIWAGRSKLPEKDVMEEWISKHQAWVRKRMAKAGPNGNGYQEIDNGEWSYFMHEAAGTGLYDHIGWGSKAWSLWWSDRELYRALTGLPVSTLTYRLFDTGKRKPYPRARKALTDAYADLVELQNKAKAKKD